MGRNIETLDQHLLKVREGSRRFENAFQSVSRMILEKGFDKVQVNGNVTYDFHIFREGKKHLIGMYDEITSLVSFVDDGAKGGPARELAFVLVGEPGNGKTFFVDALCTKYIEFISKTENQRLTFRFKGLKELGDQYGNIEVIESQTYEDPMVLAMNLAGHNIDANKEWLIEKGFNETQIENFFLDYRPLGACSDYILNDIRQHNDGNLDMMLRHIEIVPIPLSPTRGVLVGKYAPKDKITAKSSDLLGEEDLKRMLKIADANNPYLYNVKKGALARVAGGGIHFSDEIFKNKRDLVLVYLSVIQNRTIELDGYKWPMDTLIIATSNNAEYGDFQSLETEAPVIDRTLIVNMAHNTNHELQNQLTRYALGSRKRSTFGNEPLHIDPNLIRALSKGVTLTRLPSSDNLSRVDMMQLAAGQQAGEKSMKALREFIDTLSLNSDVRLRFGQSGLGHRDLERVILYGMKSSATHESRCFSAEIGFDGLKRIIIDSVQDNNERNKFLTDIKVAKELYRKEVLESIFDAYMNQPDAIKKEVKNYINMIVGIGQDNVKSDKMWQYKDPVTGEDNHLKIDESFINSVEERMGHKSKEEKEAFRSTMRKLYGQKLLTDRNYDFMDQMSLVKAVTEVRLRSDIHGAGSLIGALSNRTNEENEQLYNRMIDTMVNKLGYCPSCAEKTIEYYLRPEDD